MGEPGERRLLCSFIRSQCAEGHHAAVVHHDFRRRLCRRSEQSMGTPRFVKYCRAFLLQARDAAFDELEKFSNAGNADANIPSSCLPAVNIASAHWRPIITMKRSRRN